MSEDSFVGGVCAASTFYEGPGDWTEDTKLVQQVLLLTEPAQQPAVP